MTPPERASDYGLCRCGCGEKTTIARQTRANRGWVRGEPVSFRVGHGCRGRQAARRLSDVDYIVEDSGCWVWQLHRDRAGYAVTHINSYPHRGARVFYERYKGAIPDGYHVDHLCRNPPCVNPDHLEAVTPTENARRGAGTKITAEIALEIARSSDAGVVLAHRFGISAQNVCNIRKGRVWADVTGVRDAKKAA